MMQQMNVPREGDLHSIIIIGSHSFELRYGYCDERDRVTGEPYILYPDLLSEPRYTEAGWRIVTALQSVCEHYTPLVDGEREDCCYTCSFYPDRQSEIGTCRCKKMRKPTNGPVWGGVE